MRVRVPILRLAQELALELELVPILRLAQELALELVLELESSRQQEKKSGLKQVRLTRQSFFFSSPKAKYCQTLPAMNRSSLQPVQPATVGADSYGTEHPLHLRQSKRR